LLFYHTRLKCYVVVELKAHAFKPEHAGQLNFYLSAIASGGKRAKKTAQGPDGPAGTSEFTIGKKCMTMGRYA
jgi:hypothetical protein